MQIHAFVKNIQAELDRPGLNAFGLGDFKAPKVLGDILESIAGAVFLDAGLDTEKVWQVSSSLPVDSHDENRWSGTWIS